MEVPPTPLWCWVMIGIGVILVMVVLLQQPEVKEFLSRFFQKRR